MYLTRGRLYCTHALRRVSWRVRSPLIQNFCASLQQLKSDHYSTPSSATAVRQSGFHKLHRLSTQLAKLVDATYLSRPQVVQAIWQYIHTHNLQDPTDKRYIKCDEAMQAVFGTERIHMFTMNKVLSKHLQPKDKII